MTEPDDEDFSRKSGIAYAAVTSLVASVLTLMGIGWLLDRWLATDPWCLVGGVILGSAIGLYELVRITSKLSKD